MAKDRLLFVKEGRARFISHLDLMRTFQRAFLRADVAIKHTEGFNPHPFVSIALPLSVGFESQCEILECSLLPGVSREEVPARLDRALPEGVRVLSCYEGQRPMKELRDLDYEIRLTGGGGGDLAALWSPFLDRTEWLVEKPSKKAKSGSVTIDLAKLVKGYSFTEEKGETVLRARLSAQDPGLNPQVLTGALIRETPHRAPELIRYRRMEVLDGDGQPFR